MRYLFWILGFVPVWTWGQVPYTLSSAIERALSEHPLIESAKRQVQVAEAERMGLSVYFPALPEVEASAFHVFGGKLNSLTVSGTQALELKGQAAYRRKLGIQQVSLSELEVGAVAEGVAAAVRQAFEAVLQSQEKASLYQELAAEAQALHEAALARFKAGQLAGLEVTFAQLEAQRAQNVLAQNRVVQRRALHELAQWLHLSPDSLQISPLPRRFPRLPSDTVLVERSLALRADLKVLAFKGQVLESQQDLARLNRTPSLRAGAFFSLDNTYLPNKTSPVVGLRVILPLPIHKPEWYNDGTAEVNRVRAERTVLEAQMQAKRQMVAAGVREAAARYRTAKEAYTALQALMPSLEAAQAQLKQAYQDGRIDLSQYLIQVGRFTRARLDILEAMHSLAQAQADLEVALGGVAY